MTTVVNTPFVPLEEYLNTSYEPDCDYVDGVLEDRSAGQSKHSATQTELIFWLRARMYTNIVLGRNSGSESLRRAFAFRMFV